MKRDTTKTPTLAATCTIASTTASSFGKKINCLAVSVTLLGYMQAVLLAGNIIFVTRVDCYQ